jgi:hypothetical protein
MCRVDRSTVSGSGRPGSRTEAAAARDRASGGRRPPSVLDATIRALMLRGNAWTEASAIVAEVSRAIGGVPIGASQVLEMARRGAVLDAAGAKVRIATINPDEPTGLRRRCASCAGPFSVDGAALVRLASRDAPVPSRCGACLHRRTFGDPDAVRRRADEQQTEARVARTHRGVGVDGMVHDDFDPGEGPGAPDGCLHGLPRHACASCGPRMARIAASRSMAMQGRGRGTR